MTKFYHGDRRRNFYFEGWYLKYQTKDGYSLALIPAVHIDHEGRRSASLQVITSDRTWWLEYPETEFDISTRRFQIRMGQNSFFEEGVRLHLEQNDLTLHGTLHHGPFTPLKSDIMGPFRFLPRMECAHGVISMYHTLTGALTLNGETLDFTGGTGYIETDRGRSFPSAYLWSQCTWQEPRCGSLMLSIATIPTAVGSFTGCICAIFHEGREYRMATYRGVRIERWSDSGAVIRQGKYRLQVEALDVQGCPLKAPVEGTMGRIIHEGVCSKVRYCFWDGNQLLIDRTDSCAGFEFSDNRKG